ncbi:MAG: cation-efflux pump [Pseudomonadota bacterium]
MDKGKEKTRVALYSVLVGIILTGIKLAVGIMTGSLGILSEALHSLLDLCAALLTFLAVRFSSRPPDQTHPYGHGKIENLSALAQALLLFATCAWIVHEALSRLSGKEVTVTAGFWAFAVMGVSVVLDILISRVLRRAAKKYSSQALEADALHYTSDILSSIVVIAGLAGVRLGIPALDPVAAVGVALLITVASYRLGMRAAGELLDRAPKGLAEQITRNLNTFPGIASVDQVRLRRSGASTFIDITVSAERLMSLDESHELAETIEAGVRKIVPESDVLVHFHPSSDGESFADSVRAVARKCCPRIKDLHNIRSYQDGESGETFLSVHVRLDPGLSLKEAHALMDELEEGLKEKMPQVNHFETHLEPAQRGDIGNGKKSPLPHARLRLLKNHVMKDERIKGLHDIFIHDVPEGTVISCHVVVSEDLALDDAHGVASGVEASIRDIFPDAADVIVHTEPEP